MKFNLFQILIITLIISKIFLFNINKKNKTPTPRGIMNKIQPTKLREKTTGKVEVINHSDKKEINRYVDAKRIAEGAFGTVDKAKDTKTNKYVAIKTSKNNSIGIPADTLREIGILKALGNKPNIMQLLNVSNNSGVFVLIFEFSNSDLGKVIRNRALSNYKQAARVSISI